MEVGEAIRQATGSVASLKLTVVVEQLSQARSGKVLRGTMRLMAEGREYETPSPVEDLEILSELVAADPATVNSTARTTDAS